MGSPGYAWMLLSAIRATPLQWKDIFADFHGELPQTEQQYNGMLRTIRRMGHKPCLHSEAGRALPHPNNDGCGAPIGWSFALPTRPEIPADRAPKVRRHPMPTRVAPGRPVATRPNVNPFSAGHSVRWW